MNGPLFSTANIIDSVLSVKASGSVADVSADFDAVATKTIAELLNHEAKEADQDNQDNQKETN